MLTKRIFAFTLWNLSAFRGKIQRVLNIFAHEFVIQFYNSLNKVMELGHGFVKAEYVKWPIATKRTVVIYSSSN